MGGASGQPIGAIADNRVRSDLFKVPSLFAEIRDLLNPCFELGRFDKPVDDHVP